MGRAVHGAIAGFCATMAMTIAMQALQRRLSAEDRYPLPPREITQDVLGSGKAKGATLTILSHFGFGAFAGAAYGLMARKVPGIAFGPLVWMISYLGWIPALRILTPATRHPWQRNVLMIVAHVIWGWATSYGDRTLAAAAASSFATGRLKDRR